MNKTPLATYITQRTLYYRAQTGKKHKQENTYGIIQISK